MEEWREDGGCQGGSEDDSPLWPRCVYPSDTVLIRLRALGPVALVGLRDDRTPVKAASPGTSRPTCVSAAAAAQRQSAPHRDTLHTRQRPSAGGESRAPYPVRVVVGVALAPPLAGVAAVAAVLRVLHTDRVLDGAPLSSRGGFLRF